MRKVKGILGVKDTRDTLIQVKERVRAAQRHRSLIGISNPVLLAFSPAICVKAHQQPTDGRGFSQGSARFPPTIKLVAVE